MVQVGREVQHAVAHAADRVTVRHGACDALRADQTGGPGLIVDDDLLSEVFRHLLRHDAHHDVARTACLQRHDHQDRIGGIGLGIDGCGQQDAGDKYAPLRGGFHCCTGLYLNVCRGAGGLIGLLHGTGADLDCQRACHRQHARNRLEYLVAVHAAGIGTPDVLRREVCLSARA